MRAVGCVEARSLGSRGASKQHDLRADLLRDVDQRQQLLHLRVSTDEGSSRIRVWAFDAAQHEHRQRPG